MQHRQSWHPTRDDQLWPLKQTSVATVLFSVSWLSPQLPHGHWPLASPHPLHTVSTQKLKPASIAAHKMESKLLWLTPRMRKSLCPASLCLSPLQL